MTKEENQHGSVSLIYFSGTGNTLYVANLLHSLLEKSDVRATKYDITSPIDEKALQADIIGIGYPVHAFNSPEIVYDFCRSLSCEGKRYFVFKTSGEPLKLNNASSTLLDRALRRKGWCKLGELHVVMPYNIITRHEDLMVIQMLDKCQNLCEAFVSRLICSGECENIKSNLFQRTVSALLRIEWGGARIIGRGFKVDDKKCVKCGKCILQCPKKNITMTDKVLFGRQCNLCMRCVMRCPTDAIRAGILNGWKVNGQYDLAALQQRIGNEEDYITPNTRGIKSIYKKYFTKSQSKKF